MEIPGEVDNAEPLHRRIHPTFIRPDGRISSQAFTDPELSVDRGLYRDVAETLMNCDGFGVAVFLARSARELGQEVRADPQLLNKAHALVVGKKTKSIARRLARSSQWKVEIDSTSKAH
jgi:hypothetical protein